MEYIYMYVCIYTQNKTKTSFDRIFTENDQTQCG